MILPFDCVPRRALVTPLRAEDFFPTSVAIFATSLLEAIPIELGKCNSFFMAVCRSRARRAGVLRMSEMSKLRQWDLFHEGQIPI